MLIKHVIKLGQLMDFGFISGNFDIWTLHEDPVSYVK